MAGGSGQATAFLKPLAELATWLKFYFIAPCLVLGKRTENRAGWEFFLPEKQEAAVNSLPADAARPPAPQQCHCGPPGRGCPTPVSISAPLLRLLPCPHPCSGLFPAASASSPRDPGLGPVLPRLPTWQTTAWGSVSHRLFPRCLMGWGGLWVPPPQPCSDFAQPGIKVHSWARASPPCWEAGTAGTWGSGLGRVWSAGSGGTSRLPSSATLVRQRSGFQGSQEPKPRKELDITLAEVQPGRPSQEGPGMPLSRC